MSFQDNKRLIYLSLLILFICFIAIRGSLYFKYDETFIDNAFIVNTNNVQPQTITKTDTDFELSEQAKLTRARMNKWKDCNIFTCKNPDSEADYESWLKSQKDKLNKYLDNKNNKDKDDKKQVKKPPKCPPRISLSEWNEDILTEEEKDAQERLEEIQDQEDELNQRIRELQQRLADQERDFAMNAASQQQALNELENAKKSQKDMNFYETAINMHVKPWQAAIKKVEKKVTSYEKPINSIKDMFKKIDELKKQIESIPGVAPSQKKKRRSLGSRIRSAFR